MLTFNISGFTHRGITSLINQDRILVNNTLLSEACIHLQSQTQCSAYVADGVGGNKSGDYAADFFLKFIQNSQFKSIIDLKLDLKAKNRDFIKSISDDNKIKGAATTLSGIIINENHCEIIHAGDSEIWLLRNNIFFKLTSSMVLNPQEKSSPISSYLGGHADYLNFDENIKLNKAESADVYVVCSDGLFKALKPKLVKNILKANKSLQEKADKVLENALFFEAPDDFSGIFIECRL